MTNDEGSPNARMTKLGDGASFGFRIFVIRHSGFVIFHDTFLAYALIFMAWELRIPRMLQLGTWSFVNNASTHHDASICFLIAGLNPV
jgi:hypothetical protein